MPIYRSKVAHFLSALLCFVALNVSSALAGNYVVIAVSEGNSLTAGQVIEIDQKVELAANAKAVFISQSGEMIELTGPFSGRISNTVDKDEEQSGDLVTTVAGLILGVKKQSSVIGASRETLPSGLADKSFWLITVDSSGPRCIPNDKAFFWRKNGEEALKVSLRSATARMTGLTWPAGASSLELPSEFLVNGDLLVMKVGKSPRKFNLFIQPQSLHANDLGGALKWMLAQGCERQATVLLHQISDQL